MSFLTATNPELLYVSTLAGAAKASFTSEFQINDTATMGYQASIPPYFWQNNPTNIGKSLFIKAYGILSSTGTPTYTFSARLGSAGSTSAAIILGSAALTTGSGVSNQIWDFEGYVTMKTLGVAGANSTVLGVGRIVSPGTANKIDPLYGGAASPGTVATVDTSIQNFVNFNVACSASNASNSITLQYLAVWGLN